MANTTQIVPFAIGPGSNVMDPVAWAADPACLEGFQAGIASAARVNTALRQAGFAAGMIAKFTADYGVANVLDDGNIAEFEANFVAALASATGGLQGFLYEGNDTGTANSIQVSSLTPSLSTVGIGKVLIITKGNTDNSGAVIATVPGLANIPVRWADGTELAAGSWKGGTRAMMIYTGSVFQLLSNPGVSSGSISGGTDTSNAANSVIATVSPAITSYQEGRIYRIKIANTNTAPVLASFNGLPARSVVRQDTNALAPADIIAGEEILLIDNGASLQLAGLGRSEVPRFLASPVLYVRPGGNDTTGDGSTNSDAKAFQSVVGAVQYAERRLVTTGTAITIQLGVPGTYAAPQTLQLFGNFAIQGDVANAGSYILAGSNGGGNPAVMNVFGGQLALGGLTIQNNSSAYASLYVAAGCSANISNVLSVITGGNSAGHYIAGLQGFIGLNDNCHFRGAAAYMWYAGSGGGFSHNPGVAVTIEGTPAFSQATVISNGGQLGSGPGASFIGNATGSRYLAQNGGLITCGAGVNFYPGDQPGNSATGYYQ